MDIPQGYKQTELGIIPEDWEIVNLGSIAKINGRIGFRGYTVADLVPKGFGAITLSPSNIINNHIDYTNCTYISWYKYNESPEIQVQNGDILLVKTGSTFGKSAFVKDLPEKATINPQFVLLNAFKCDNKYLSYVIAYDVIQNQIHADVVGGAIPTLSQEKIANFSFFIPKKQDEQRAIAEALSDMDGLIEALDKKIAKKRLIKQGTMQQLLTGKKRLPGFTDPWVEKKFSDLYRYASEGGTPDTNNIRFYANGDVPFVKIEDTETKYIESCNSFITSEGINNSSAWIVPVNSIIYTNGATIGNVSINKIPVATKQGILGIIPSSIINIEFMYYLLLSQNFKREVDSRQAKGTFATIILKSLDEIPIYLPLNQMEQIAIATILSDMDKEIAALEARRDKYSLLKSGMMQKLLTGQIRLKKE